MEELEAWLRNQILWSLPIERPGGEAESDRAQAGGGDRAGDGGSQAA